MPAQRIRKNQILSALLNTAYLPTELPPVVTARNFSSFAKDNYDRIKGFKTTETTHFEKYSIPRENGARRDLAIVHPAAQLVISNLLTDNHHNIRTIITSSKISLYEPMADLDNFKAFRGINFRGLDQKRSIIAKKKPFVLNADISRFFYTIYTHSIPWALLGKEKVKDTLKKRKKLSHWTDKLDKALQACQSQETFGIPVGPDTSRIIAEILLSGVHNDDSFGTIISAAPGFRLVDDFFLGFDSEAECRTALVALRNALSHYNLQLNDDKTWIKPSREIFTDRWRHELLHTPISQDDAARQAKGINRLTETALYHASCLGNGYPIKWAAQKLSHIKFDQKNFGLLLSILLRLARDFPVCMDIVAAYIINNKNE